MSAKKSRFDGLDVAAMTSHIKRTMLGFKLANVYDGNALGVSGTASSSGGSGDSAKGVYMFKLADPSGGGATATAKNDTSAASSNNTIAENEGKADEENNNAEEQAGTESIQQLDQKRAMLLIESGVRFHPTT